MNEKNKNEENQTYPGGAKKVAYGINMPAEGRETAPNKSKFMSFLLPMSGTRSAGMLVAWHLIFQPFPFPTNGLVLVSLGSRAWDGDNTPFVIEHS